MSPPAATDRHIARRAFAFVKPHTRLLAIAALTLPAVSLTRLVAPYLLKLAIDGPVRHGPTEDLIPIAIAYLALVAVQGGLNLANTYIVQLLGQRVVTDLRSKLFEAVTRLRMSYFDKTPIGRLINRLTNDIDALQEFLSSGLVEIVADGIMLIGIVAVMFWLDARLALTSFAMLPLLILFVASVRKTLRVVYGRLSTKNARALAYSQEAISGLGILQAFRREQGTEARYVALADDALTENLEGVKWNSLLSAIVELASYLSIGLVLFVGASETTSLGTIVVFIEYIQLFYRPVESLSGRIAVFQKAIASAEKIFALFDDAEREADPSGAAAVPKLEQGIRFEQVELSYIDGTPVLRGLDLEVPRGQTYALVGATGAGKSSLVKLLSRLYEPQGGRVLWDGRDIREFDTASLRRRIGAVPQETFLFSDTLANNISLDREDVDLAAEAAAAVRADRVAADLPGGFAEVIGEQGRDLSAGERQLIAFARALAQDPDVLILDEATATIDGETEAVIQDSLRTLLKGRTALVIAHRLSTIREADQICVLHKGELREQGTHDELIAQRGLYYTLYKLQGEAEG